MGVNYLKSLAFEGEKEGWQKGLGFGGCTFPIQAYVPASELTSWIIIGP